jgi:hypothetical protein
MRLLDKGGLQENPRHHRPGWPAVKDGPLVFNGCLDEANTEASAAAKAGT